jgi:hypothetical protein
VTGEAACFAGSIVLPNALHEGPSFNSDQAMFTFERYSRWFGRERLRTGLLLLALPLFGCAQTGAQANRSDHSPARFGQRAVALTSPVAPANHADDSSGPRGYDALTGNFEEPWPYGPVSNN